MGKTSVLSSHVRAAVCIISQIDTVLPSPVRKPQSGVLPSIYCLTGNICFREALRAGRSLAAVSMMQEDGALMVLPVIINCLHPQRLPMTAVLNKLPPV